MDFTSWVALLAAMCGAAVTIYGAVILVTGRATRGDQRAFRSTRDAGLYYLCFGLAMTLLYSSILWNTHHHSLLAVVALIGTLVLATLAVIRYRPAKSRR